MKPVLPGDLSAAARALLAEPPPRRVTLARRLVREAVLADTHMRRHHAPHVVFGDGTLGVAARRRRLAREPYCDDPDYARCLIVVLEEVLASRNRTCA